MKLKNIAKEIINPPHVKSQGDGNIKILSASSIKGLTVDENIFSLGNTEKNIENALLKEGDILYLAKGNKFDAGIVEKDCENTIPSQLFFIIRVDRKRFNPKYITWYLKSETVRRYIDKFTSGSVVKTVRKTVLEDVAIPNIDLNSQNKIVEIIESFEVEKSKTEEYLEKKELLIEEKILDHIRGGN